MKIKNVYFTRKELALGLISFLGCGACLVAIEYGICYLTLFVGGLL